MIVVNRIAKLIKLEPLLKPLIIILLCRVKNSTYIIGVRLGVMGRVHHILKHFAVLDSYMNHQISLQKVISCREACDDCEKVPQGGGGT